MTAITANVLRSTKAAIKRYGASVCERAYFAHYHVGEGAATIASQYGLPRVTTTNAADAAINAGCVLKQLRDSFLRTDAEENLLHFAHLNQNPVS